MFHRLLVLVALPSALAAQQVGHTSMLPVPAGVVHPRTAVLGASVIEVKAPDMAVAATDTVGGERKIGRYTLTGLGVGAVAGVTGGAIGSRYAGCGCSNSEKTLGFALWFGVIGAGAGTIVGAVIGALHDHWR